MRCAICQTRRPRRYCPGVCGDICPLCCGAEREMTVDCPLDCQYLQDARKHEKPVPINPAEFPNRDIRISETFLNENENLLVFLGRVLLRSALRTAGAIDYDVREALEALIRTYRTLQSGVYYETRPSHPIAANIYDLLQTDITEYRRTESERVGMSRIRDADVLGILVFLQRLELNRNNRRKRGRAFLDFVRGQFLEPSETLAQPAASSLIIP